MYRCSLKVHHVCVIFEVIQKLSLDSVNLGIFHLINIL